MPGPASTDPCTPAAAGGYLGADNQLVRVTVTAYNATTNTGTLLWGWNNASLLYRASMTNPQTLTLTSVPVDEEHAPQLGQAVEILRCRSNLTDGNYIAAPEGFVTTLTQAYSFDTGTLGLADALPAAYQADKNPLFVRLWQASVPFTAGQVTPLDSVSGITVTITLPALPTSIALRPFWRFSVRPSTPVQIYPQRYQETPQPPDGPRQWMTDLAVVQAQTSGSTLLANCRVPFKPLTLQTGACCSLVLGPNDVDGRGGLQAVMDSLAGTRSSVALLPGTYTLPQPLLLLAQHSGLTLEACGPGVVLTASASNLTAFLFGMIVLDAAANVIVRGLSFTIPNVLVPQSTNAAGVTTTGTSAVAANTAVAAGAVDARLLTVNTAANATVVGAAAAPAPAAAAPAPAAAAACGRRACACGRCACGGCGGACGGCAEHQGSQHCYGQPRHGCRRQSGQYHSRQRHCCQCRNRQSCDCQRGGCQCGGCQSCGCQHDRSECCDCQYRDCQYRHRQHCDAQRRRAQPQSGQRHRRRHCGAGATAAAGNQCRHPRDRLAQPDHQGLQLQRQSKFGLGVRCRRVRAGRR